MISEKYIRSIGSSCILILLVHNISCTEPFDIPTTDATNSLLVVDARITNENKKQIVRLSRSVALDSVEIAAERGATVAVQDNLGNAYDFSETEVGVYTSNNEFGALPGISYTLTVQTRDGNTYASDETSTPPLSKIDRIYAEQGVKDSTETGVFIYLDNAPSSLTEPLYYKYEYEETYKIIAPFYVPEEAYFSVYIPNIPSGGTIDVRRRIQEERVCYGSDISRDIVLVNTDRLLGSRVEKFPIRFVNKENFTLTHRYSILVRQFSQSLAAFTYYQTLANLSTSENVFSQVQTGFLAGNITSLEDSNEQVLGYFEITTLDEQRIFFEYADIFPGEPLPIFPFACDFFAPSDGLRSAVEFERLEFFQFYDAVTWPDFFEPGPYVMVPRICGDCTVLGSNVVPDFWIE